MRPELPREIISRHKEIVRVKQLTNRHIVARLWHRMHKNAQEKLQNFHM